MRTLLLAALTAALLAAATSLAAPADPDEPERATRKAPTHLSISKAKTTARIFLRPPADLLTTTPRGFLRLGSCHRRSRSLVSCRFIMRGDTQTCRGRVFVRLTGPRYLGWMRDLGCEAR